MAMRSASAHTTIEVQIDFEYDYRPGAEPKMPSFRDEVGDPGYPEEIEITKITKFSILEPRRDPLPDGSWTKTKWMEVDLLQHICKFMPPAKFAELFVDNDYVRELMEDAAKERERD